MPTLFRLLSFVALAGIAGYGVLWGVATFVKPKPREIVDVVTVPGFTRAASPSSQQGPPAGIATAAGDTRIGRSVALTLEDQARFLTRHRRHHAQAH